MRNIVILSLPRSGTSILTNIVSKLGASLPDDCIPPHPDLNPDGFFESAHLLQIRIELEAALGLNFAFPMSWCRIDWDAALKREDVTALAERAKSYFLDKKVQGVSNFVYKDPRTTVLLPFWRNVFQEAGIDTHYILNIREPLEVARSIKKFNNHSITMGTLLWLESVWLSLEAVQELTFTLVFYGKWFTGTEQVENVCISLFEHNCSPETKNLIHGHVKPHLRRNTEGDISEEEIVRFSRDLYKQLLVLPTQNSGLSAGVLDNLNLVISTLRTLGSVLHPDALERMLDFDRRNFQAELKQTQLEQENEALKNECSHLQSLLESATIKTDVTT